MSTRPLGPNPGARRPARPDRDDPYSPFLDLVRAALTRSGRRREARIADEIERLSSARPRPGARAVSARRVPATAFLDGALALGTSATADLVGGVASMRRHLTWTKPDADGVGWSVAGRIAWAEIVGPKAPVPCDEMRLGLHLQGPRTAYPAHLHAADELYLTLAGEAWWARDEVREDAPDRPGAFRYHAPCAVHAVETRTKPMLAIYLWWGPGARDGAEGYHLV